MLEDLNLKWVLIGVRVRVRVRDPQWGQVVPGFQTHSRRLWLLNELLKRKKKKPKGENVKVAQKCSGVSSGIKMCESRLGYLFFLFELQDDSRHTLASTKRSLISPTYQTTAPPANVVQADEGKLGEQLRSGVFCLPDGSRCRFFQTGFHENLMRTKHVARFPVESARVKPRRRSVWTELSRLWWWMKLGVAVTVEVSIPDRLTSNKPRFY